MAVQPTPDLNQASAAGFGFQTGTILHRRARQKYTWTLLTLSVALFACYLAAGSILLPAQVASLDPAHKETNLAIVTSISSFATLFVQPIVGALSDRTRSRWGRRAPWMLGGAVLGGIMLILLPWIGANVGLIALMWVFAQVSLNALQAPLIATVSDRLDPEHRGKASAFLGVGTTLGMTLGVVVAGLLLAQAGLAYAIFAVAVIVLAFVFITVNADASSKEVPTSPFSWKAFLGGFWISPRRHPDFAWAFAGRFTMFLGYMGITMYLFYILLSYVKMAPIEAGAFMGLQAVIGAVASIGATFVAGWLSDRLRRRKIFIFAASLLVALGVAIPLLMPTPVGILLYAVVAGVGFGSYMAVDVALVVDVLPNPDHAAKDLGVINIANNIPQMLAPIINAALISVFGYSSIFVWSIVVVLLSSVLVFPIKKVR
ncbi:MFS transporter [Sinomonas susongensis]|uniref:MFS transporter n=1 Tax=Sinomonas susongensis TaxID=1324851 RepID=UPI00110906B9|nr:MFS transporter [Sinomonas susongensis]